MDQKLIAWKWQSILPAGQVELLELALEPFEAAMDIAHEEGDAEAKVTAFFPSDHEHADIVEALRDAQMTLGVAPNTDLQPVYDQNWQAASMAGFPPRVIGPYVIHNFKDEPLPEGKLPLYIPAAMAFGTGEHATTAGCLELYETLPKDRKLKILDMGAGSGILAIAAAKRDGHPSLAVDNDEPSVVICDENAENNGVKVLVESVCGDGFNTAAVAAQGPFDLIFANILKNPLIEMAPALKASLEVGGVAILSGFTAEQEADVLAAYSKQGLSLKQRTQGGDWVAIIVG
jgi:ribosomal protein L11 methyltransferase